MDISASPTPQELGSAPMATLTRIAATPEARGYTEAVIAVLEDHEAAVGTRQRRRSKAGQVGFLRALEAFLGDLLKEARMTQGR